MDKEFNYYRQELTALKETMDQNEFHFFLTVKDTRERDKNRSFRRTDETGYTNREVVLRRIMGTFRSSYHIRSPRGLRPEYFFVAVHEAGVGREHVLTEDSGHLHIAIGFRKESQFYLEPLKHFTEFQKSLKSKFRWMDCCDSLLNRGEKLIINDQKSVAEYISKHEKGTINGEPFFKRPIFWNVPSI